jgi:hypothetical protein
MRSHFKWLLIDIHINTLITLICRRKWLLIDIHINTLITLIYRRKWYINEEPLPPTY